MLSFFQKPILFVVGSMTSYKIHKAFAEFLVKQGRKIALLYDREPDAFFAEMTRDAAAMGAKALSLDAAIQPGPHAPPWSPSSPPTERARRFEDYRAQSSSGRMKAFSDVILGRMAAAHAVLQKLRPPVVIVAEDGVAGPLALIAAAQQRGIPVAVLPYGYGTERDFEIALEAKAARGELQKAEGPDGEMIRAHAPEWIKRGPFEGALLFPADYVVVLESAGIRINHAWIVHGGTADRLCVESPQMMRLYQSEGLPAEKLALTGSPYGDFVLDSLRNDEAARTAFRKPQKIFAGETRILVSWPPSYHADRGSHSEFPSYLDMTKAVLAGLQALPRTRVTVSLHPAVSAEDRAAIASMGVELSPRYVLELIPQHDVYVSYYSSTIRWAVASGKPVLNYDAYKLGLDVYDAAPGVVTLASATALIERARELAASDAAYAALAAEQVRVAPEWGLLDEPAMPRILTELERLRR